MRWTKILLVPQNDIFFPLQFWTFTSYSYCSSNYIVKVVSLNLFASFLYRFLRSVHGFFFILLPILLSFFQLLPFRLLKVIARKKKNLYAIAFKSERVTTISIIRQLEENKKQKTYSKRKQRRSRAITLKGAIEKSPILLPIIFLPTTLRSRTGESEW